MKIWGIVYTWIGVVFIRGLLVLVFSQLPNFLASCFAVGCFSGLILRGRKYGPCTFIPGACTVKREAGAFISGACKHKYD